MGHILPQQYPHILGMIIINCGNMWKHCSVSGIPVCFDHRNSRALLGVRWRQDSEPVAVAPTKPESGEEEHLIVAGCNGLVVRCGNGWNPVPKNRPMTGFICFFGTNANAVSWRQVWFQYCIILYIYTKLGVCVCIYIYIRILYIYNTNAWYEQITYGYTVIRCCVCVYVNYGCLCQRLPVETGDGTRSAKVEIYERQSSCHQRQEKSLAGHEEQQVQRSSEWNQWCRCAHETVLKLCDFAGLRLVTGFQAELCKKVSVRDTWSGAGPQL